MGSMKNLIGVYEVLIGVNEELIGPYEFLIGSMQTLTEVYELLSMKYVEFAAICLVNNRDNLLKGSIILASRLVYFGCKHGGK